MQPSTLQGTGTPPGNKTYPDSHRLRHGYPTGTGQDGAGARPATLLMKYRLLKYKASRPGQWVNQHRQHAAQHPTGHRHPTGNKTYPGSHRVRPGYLTGTGQHGAGPMPGQCIKFAIGQHPAQHPTGHRHPTGE